jgi:hypothetical protein
MVTARTPAKIAMLDERTQNPISPCHSGFGVLDVMDCVSLRKVFHCQKEMSAATPGRGSGHFAERVRTTNNAHPPE